jgi:hypothetical protein
VNSNFPGQGFPEGTDGILIGREFNTYRKQKSPEGLEKPLFFCQIFLILVLYVSYVYGIIEKGDFF